MSDINERIAKVKEQIIETKIFRHHFGLTDYDDITDNFEVFITTIESQKEEIEKLELDRNDWKDEYMSLKRRFEELDKSALETLELLNGPNEQIESLKAITELAVKGLKEIACLNADSAYSAGTIARNTFSEIVKLKNE